MKRVIRTMIAALAFTSLAAGLAKTEDFSLPTGPIALTVTVSENSGASKVVDFDVPMLKALGEVTIETSTPWTEGVQTFSGVPLIRLLEALGITDGVLKAVAINDYAVDIPVSDAVEGGPIIAFLHNGSEMTVRNKGPLWVVYPYDKNSAYQSEVIYSRSIWQLVKIDVIAK